VSLQTGVGLRSEVEDADISGNSDRIAKRPILLTL